MNHFVNHYWTYIYTYYLQCARKGTIVSTINATDRDTDYNNQLIKYEFLYSNSSTGQHFESFSIDNKTGVITLTGSLDREEKPSFKVFYLITRIYSSYL